MCKMKATSIYTFNAKKCAMWKSAIEDAKRLISETSDKKRIRRLHLSIKWFNYMIEIGEPFPGEFKDYSHQS